MKLIRYLEETDRITVGLKTDEAGRTHGIRLDFRQKTDERCVGIVLRSEIKNGEDSCYCLFPIMGDCLGWILMHPGDQIK